MQKRPGGLLANSPDPLPWGVWTGGRGRGGVYFLPSLPQTPSLLSNQKAHSSQPSGWYGAETEAANTAEETEAVEAAEETEAANAADAIAGAALC